MTPSVVALTLTLDPFQQVYPRDVIIHLDDVRVASAGSILQPVHSRGPEALDPGRDDDEPSPWVFQRVIHVLFLPDYHVHQLANVRVVLSQEFQQWRNTRPVIARDVDRI